MEPEQYQTFNNIMASVESNRKNIDQFMIKDMINRIRFLMRRDELSKEDLSELLYLLTATELKMTRFSLVDRRILGKFFVWLRDFVSLTGEYYDFIADERKNFGLTGSENSNGIIQETTPQFRQEIEKLLERAMHGCLSGTKFLSDVYLFIERSGLSVEGWAFNKMAEKGVALRTTEETKLKK